MSLFPDISDHYDKNGKWVGYSMPGIFRDVINHYDREGKWTGYTQVPERASGQEVDEDTAELVKATLTFGLIVSIMLLAIPLFLLIWIGSKVIDIIAWIIDRNSPPTASPDPSPEPDFTHPNPFWREQEALLKPSDRVFERIFIFVDQVFYRIRSVLGQSARAR